jgi:hypothetical protein
LFSLVIIVTINEAMVNTHPYLHKLCEDSHGMPGCWVSFAVATFDGGVSVYTRFLHAILGRFCNEKGTDLHHKC